MYQINKTKTQKNSSNNTFTRVGLLCFMGLYVVAVVSSPVWAQTETSGALPKGLNAEQLNIESAKQEKIIQASSHPIRTYQSYGETSVRELEYLNFLQSKHYKKYITELSVAKHYYLSSGGDIRKWEYLVGANLKYGSADKNMTEVLLQTPQLLEYLKQHGRTVGYNDDFDGPVTYGDHFMEDIDEVYEIAKNNAEAAKNNAEAAELRQKIAERDKKREILEKILGMGQ